MSSFRLAYEDYVERSEFDGSLGSSGPVPDVAGSFDSLKDMRLAKAAVWSDLGTLVMYVTFAEPAPVQLVSILDVRIDGPIACQIHFYDMDENLKPIRHDADLIEYPGSDFVRHQHAILPAPAMAKGIRVALGGDASAPLSIGRLWAGPLWAPPDGIKRRWQQSVIDPGEMAISRGGQGYPRQRQRRRRLDVELSHMPYEWAFGREDNAILDLQQIGYRVGTTEPVICFPRTLTPAGDIDTHAIHRLGVYGHLTEPLRIRHVAGPYFDAEMRVDELL